MSQSSTEVPWDGDSEPNVEITRTASLKGQLY